MGNRVTGHSAGGVGDRTGKEDEGAGGVGGRAAIGEDEGDTLPSPAGIAAAWRRERPGTPTASIEIVTPIWRLAKLFADDRVRVLRASGIDAATLDLLSVLRRSGPPYELTTRQLARRTMVTAGAVSQRVARAERDGLVSRAAAAGGRRAVLVSLTPAGHALVERSVDAVLGREASLVAGLSPAERATLTDLLGRLTAEVGRALS